MKITYEQARDPVFIEKLKADNPDYEYRWVGLSDYLNGFHLLGWESAMEGFPPEPEFRGIAIGLMRRKRNEHETEDGI